MNYRTGGPGTEVSERTETIHKRRNGANGGRTEKTGGLAPRVARRRGCGRTADASTPSAPRVFASAVLPHPHGADLRSAPEPQPFLFVSCLLRFAFVDSVAPFVNLRSLHPLRRKYTIPLEGRMRRIGWLSCATLALAGVLAAAQDGDWSAYGRDPGGERFSPLDRIKRENVGSLQVAWTFRTGDAYEPKAGRGTAFETTPLYVDGTLYLSTPVGRVIALDPVSGQQRWAFDAKSPRDMGYGDFASRGVSTWQRGGERRIFVATIDARLIALDSRTGKPVAGFGDRGIVDLRQGLRIPPVGFADYEVTSPPAVVGNTIVVGSGICGRHIETASERRSAGLRCRDRQAQMDLGSGSAGPICARSGLVEEPQRPPRRRRQRLVRHRGGSLAQPGLRANEQSQRRLFRRRAARRQPVLGFDRRAAWGHRGACLALPDGSPRSVGLRRRVAANPVRLAQGRPHGRRGGGGLQDGPSLHPRSRDRDAVDSRRGASCPQERRPWRGGITDTALPDGAACARAHDLDCRRRLGRDGRGSRLVPRDDERAAR